MKYKPNKHIIVPDRKYLNKYVAMVSFIDKTVVASGNNHDAVLARAKAKGIKHPVMMFNSGSEYTYYERDRIDKL